jgi:hypothetical protein
MEIPNFSVNKDPSKFWDHFHSFVRSIGFAAVMLPQQFEPDCYYLASGVSSRGVSHMVVMCDGKVVHDPHPSDEGLKTIDHIWLLTKGRNENPGYIQNGILFYIDEKDKKSVSFGYDNILQVGTEDQALSNAISLSHQKRGVTFGKKTRIVVRHNTYPDYSKDKLIEFSNLRELCAQYPLTFKMCLSIWPEEFDLDPQEVLISI